MITTDFLKGVHSILNGQFDGDEPANDSSVSGYAEAKAPPKTAAENAVMTSLNIAPMGAGWKAWASLLGGGSVGGGVGNLYGGVIGGGHTQVAPGTKLGVLAGAVTSSTASGGGLTVSTGTGFIGLYGQTKTGVVELDYSLIAGVNGHNTRREVIVLGTAQTATSAFTSYFISPSIGASIPVLTTDKGELSVAGELSYVGGGSQAHTETAPGFAVAYGAEGIGVLDARIGLKGKTTITGGAHGDVTLTGQAGLFAESNLGGSSLPVTFNGVTQTAPAPGGTAYGVYAEAGFSAPISDKVAITGSLNGELASDATVSGGGSIGVKGSF